MNLTIPQKLIAAGYPEKALAALPAAGSTDDPRFDIIRSRVFAETSNFAEGLAVLDFQLTRFPTHSPTLLFHGIHSWDNGNVTEALGSFNKVLDRQRNNDLAKSYRALCLCALGEASPAADEWRKYGFSDNAMFRVRVAEYLETSWLRDQSFFTEKTLPEAATSRAVSQRKALSQFYRRNFRSILEHVPAAPTDKELPAFLAATAHEMLRQYSAARQYLQPFQSRRSEWPDPLIALNARLMVRQGDIAAAARELAGIVLMGPEDFGVNYYMGVICLAYNKTDEARRYFLRAFTAYMVDTLEFQWWQIEQVLLYPQPEERSNAAAASTAL